MPFRASDRERAGPFVGLDLHRQDPIQRVSPTESLNANQRQSLDRKDFVPVHSGECSDSLIMNDHEDHQSGDPSDVPKVGSDARRGEAVVLPKHYNLSHVDVGCGRGQRYCNHVGNQRFRAIVRKHVETYIQANTKLGKTALIVSILEEVRKGEAKNKLSVEQGRFVKQQEDGTWVELGDAASRDKVSNALRSAVALYKGLDTGDMELDASTASPTSMSSTLELPAGGESVKLGKATSHPSKTLVASAGATQLHKKKKKKLKKKSKPVDRESTIVSNSGATQKQSIAELVDEECLRRQEERAQVVAALAKYHELLAAASATATATKAAPGTVKRLGDSGEKSMGTKKRFDAGRKRKHVGDSSGEKKKRETPIDTKTEDMYDSYHTASLDNSSSLQGDIVTPPVPRTIITTTSMSGCAFLPRQHVVTPRDDGEDGHTKGTKRIEITSDGSLMDFGLNLFKKQDQQPKSSPPATSIMEDLSAVTTLLLIKQSNGSLLPKSQQ
uniref:DUF6824 domain-containing protein n=1 Tax=Entomoneis paludosa TaxID=265537 RepID=A0A7S2VAY0_9STRA|mmetsp:Transcript_1266/g.2780  ORF Transcript_1266/g.2780 Transcript_1266/m.2780 type:complete len:500 (+) Transcript_1266:319-1818(+)|eukprot:CAMPEP_0172463650 /NCGR_PEP_ID=MMETSP1065-20121228/47979_1 /TAXON_ID=265537 /ORGANISM="Amphiprora paludosa, Strain CCMP125" /LENGTH=499 /DNA_ID=CAMNT_0013219657 /DNA_START=211 /DNA_END=1710 /DNA_ORIENTATION=-